MKSFANNKRIAKNTVFLYLRQLVTMLLSFLGTGIVMRELGVDDYGLYNVIGGIVILFSSIQVAMAVGTQRYLNYEMGRGDSERVREVFNISLLLYFLIGIFVVCVCETVGLWFLNNRLVIPEGRDFAARCVYQVSIVNCFLSITQTPYTADIIANEKMTVYGYLGIGEASAKFILILLLVVINADKLILYAIFTLIVGIVFRLIYQFYCRCHFPETVFRKPTDKGLAKDIVAFSGWSFLPQISYGCRNQGGALIVNSFFGVALNASLAVANNVSNAITSFVRNFQTAYRPQLVKMYAARDIDGVLSLFFMSSKISAFLILFFAVPAMTNIDFLLSVWLGTIPEKSQLLICILLVEAFVDSLFSPFWMTIYALGDIKRYQITEGLLVLLNVPLMLVAFLIGLQIEWIFIIRLLLLVCLFLYAAQFITKKIQFPIAKYMSVIIIPILLVALLIIPVMLFVGSFFDGFGKLLVTVPLYCVIFIPAYLFLALSKEDRLQICGIVSKFLRK